MTVRTGSRRKAREMAMQMLYQADVGRQTPDEVRRLFWQAREPVDDEVRGFAEDIFRVVTERSVEIDELIERHARNWRVERMAAVDRNLMRVAVGEMLGWPAMPMPVILNESIEIARRYAAPESIPFVNGLLGAVAKSVLAERAK
jgi:N utilization substance protein B